MSRRTRANFIAAEKLAEENKLLLAKIEWLLRQLHSSAELSSVPGASFRFCPPGARDGCEFTYWDGVKLMPCCSVCWRKALERMEE